MKPVGQASVAEVVKATMPHAADGSAGHVPRPASTPCPPSDDVGSSLSSVRPPHEHAANANTTFHRIRRAYHSTWVSATARREVLGVTVLPSPRVLPIVGNRYEYVGRKEALGPSCTMPRSSLLP
jgi:hypothetical protein